MMNHAQLVGPDHEAQRRARVRRARALRGYSLPMVILLMTVLAAAGAAAVLVMSSAAETTGTMINRRQAFYACDGIGRAAMVKAREYMKNDSTPTTDELMTAVCGAVSSCPNAASFTPTGFSINSLQLSTSGTSGIQPLPNGPFRGMNARQTNISVSVEATKLATSARCRINENISLGEIGLFQFFVFADGYMDLYNGPFMDIDGRVHVNGDFNAANCVGALQFSQVTASGRIKTSGTGFGKLRLCSGTSISIKDATTSTFRQLAASGESGCAACTPVPGSGAWKAYAQTRWSGNVQDVEHNVPNLRLPFVGTASVQDGRDASGGGLDNSIRMRAIVDPVMAADSNGIAAQKLAFKSDIRIINGVWHLANVNDRRAIGTPIWSDHPGNYTLPAVDPEGVEPGNLQVGQSQIRINQGWGAAPAPRMYSYYGFEPNPGPNVNKIIDDGTQSVVSYGAVKRTGGAGTPFMPAFFRGNNAAADRFCNNKNLAAGVEGMVSVTVPLNSAAGCGILAPVYPNDEKGPALLQAARSGFQDWRVRLTNGQQAAKIMPINFDVAALNLALQNAGVGELGSYFSARPFNGIVYISNTWRGSMANMSSAQTVQATPTRWPDVDNAVIASAPPQPLPSVADQLRVARRLPFPLCSESLGDVQYGHALNPGAAPFVIPHCNAAGNGGDGLAGTFDDDTVRVNAVRVINAQTLDITRFPRGLSIATNLPIYVQGDTNTSSNAAPRLPPSVNLASNWKPMMIAGDAVTLLSNSWNDELTHFNAASTFGVARTPTATTWLIAVIGGNVETSGSVWGGGINNFPRFLERWSDTASGGGAAINSTIIGSLVIGFRSVYHHQPWDTDAPAADVYFPPIRTWLYDTNLSLPSDQPPGTPSFFVQAIQNWTRQ